MTSIALATVAEAGRTEPVCPETVRRELERVRGYQRVVGYASEGSRSLGLYTLLTDLFMMVGSPRLEALTVELLETVHQEAPRGSSRRRATFRLARSLHGMGLLPRAIPHRPYRHDAAHGADPEWATWCERWLATSTLATRTRRSIYYGLLKAGRWLAETHPSVRSPDGWTREVGLAYVVAVNGLAIGDLSAPSSWHLRPPGKPISANYKVRLLGAVRAFLRDAQEWGWCTRRLDPHRVFATPRSVKAQIGPQPRLIADDVWAKLLWAGINLDASDLPSTGWYPLTLIRALVVTWLFAGLRSDELVRLRVGCIRWQRADGGPAAANAHVSGDDATCLLDVPTHKTGASYTKPVDPLVGEAIALWEAKRPPQPLLVDAKTAESVAVFFCFRGRRVPPRYLNKTLIPALCHKAGVPREDARGRITSHRARTTIATQLYNAKEPMTLFELQAWLGHRSPLSTQYYAKILPTTLARAYADAGYFARNVRAIEVLVDRESVQNGTAAGGSPWQYFDLGHGFCTYSFFEQCPHRMACARCDFYLPKDSARAQLLEARGNLQRMLAQIPLTDDERAAVEDGTAAVERLLVRLVDTPTPAGPTTRELSAEPIFIPLAHVIGSTA
jgi:integrase